jgi:hypothetical protein
MLFSGSLYLLAALKAANKVGITGIGILTPIGGLLFIAGWLLVPLLSLNVRKILPADFPFPRWVDYLCLMANKLKKSTPTKLAEPAEKPVKPTKPASKQQKRHLLKHLKRTATKKST